MHTCDTASENWLIAGDMTMSLLSVCRLHILCPDESEESCAQVARAAARREPIWRSEPGVEAEGEEGLGGLRSRQPQPRLESSSHITRSMDGRDKTDLEDHKNNSTSFSASLQSVHSG